MKAFLLAIKTSIHEKTKDMKLDSEYILLVYGFIFSHKP